MFDRAPPTYCVIWSYLAPVVRADKHLKALSWYKDVAEKLRDPAYSGWFLHFRPGGAADLGNNSYHSPRCTGRLCSELYHSQDQTPRPAECSDGRCDCGGVPCGEYLWDHRNESLREWLISEHVMGSLGMGHPNVSGFYFDDEWARSGHGWATLDLTGKPLPYNQSDCHTGPSEIEQHCLLDMGLSAADVREITLGWRNTTAAVLRAVHSAGGWAWQMFTENDVSYTQGPNCTAQYRRACTATSSQQTHITSFRSSLRDSHSPGSMLDPEADVAKFLVLRGPYAYLGTGWVGCIGQGAERHSNETYARPAAFDGDYGIPVDLVCQETQPGEFTREWTNAVAVHSCNTGKSAVRMKKAVGSI